MSIEQIAPELERIVSNNAEIKELGSGFGGEQGPAEGPLWWQEGGYLLFSDIQNNCRMKWSPGAGMTVAFAPSNRSNGLTRDLSGRLLACEHDSRRVTSSGAKVRWIAKVGPPWATYKLGRHCQSKLA